MLQQIVLVMILLGAAFFVARQLIRQFSGDGESSKCASCELNKAVSKAPRQKN